MLAPVDTWVLDLDNTLYPPSTGLADQMNTRIREYLSTLYAVDEPTARKLQHSWSPSTAPPERITRQYAVRKAWRAAPAGE